MTEYTQENSVMLNIYHIWETVTNPYENSSLANIIKINKQDNIVLANIPYSFNFVIANLFIANNLQNNSVKAHITISFNNSAIANIIGGYNFLSLANILKIPTQNNSTLASLLTAIANNSVISNIQIANARIPTNVKNLTIGFGEQPGQAYFKDADLNTTVSGGLVTPEGLQMARSGTGSSTVTLSGTGDPNRLDEYTSNWSFSLTNKKVFGLWHLTLWQTSESDNNIIPSGSNVDPDDYEFLICSDFRNLPSSKSDLSKIWLRVWIRNKNASPRTVLQKTEVRYIIESGTL